MYLLKMSFAVFYITFICLVLYHKWWIVAVVIVW